MNFSIHENGQKLANCIAIAGEKLPVWLTVALQWLFQNTSHIKTFLAMLNRILEKNAAFENFSLLEDE